jgi:signal transduction histidine kinase
VREKQIEKYPDVLKHLGSILKFISKDLRTEYEESYNILKIALDDFEQTQKTIGTVKEDLEKAQKRIVFLESITSEDTKEVMGLQHQITQVTGIIDNELKELKTKIDRDEKFTQDDLLKIIDTILLENQKVLLFSKWVTKANYDTLADKLKDEDIVFFIRQYIENVAKDRKLIEAYSKLNIELDCEEGIEFNIDFRPLEISVIFDNLFSNAIKAKSQNLVIKLTKISEKTLEIRVKDDGNGIPKTSMNKIFNFGFTTTDGSGMGLHHVKRVLKRMNGDIKINQDLESGAEFIITVKK